MQIQIADYQDYRNYKIAKATEARGGLTWREANELRIEKNRAKRANRKYSGDQKQGFSEESYDHDQSETMKAMR